MEMEGYRFECKVISAARLDMRKKPAFAKLASHRIHALVNQGYY